MENRWFVIGIVAGALATGGWAGIATNALFAQAQPKADEKKADKDAKAEEAKAKKSISDALDLMAKSAGYHFAGNRQTEFLMAMGGRGMKSETPFEGITQNPDKKAKDQAGPLTYMTYETSGMGGKQKYELYQQGVKRYARNITAGKEIDPNDTKTRVPTPMELIGPVIETLEKHKAAGEEKLGETECLLFEAVIGKKGADHVVSLQPTMMPLPPSDRAYAQASFKIWLDKKDKTVRRITLFVDSSSGISDGGGQGVRTSRKILLDANFSDYGKDIVIELPDETKKALEPDPAPKEKDGNDKK